MRFRVSIIRLVALAAVLSAAGVVVAGITVDEAAKGLPDQIEGFQARGATGTSIHIFREGTAPGDFGVVSQAGRSYSSPNGEVFHVDLLQTISDSGAFALLTANRMSSQYVKLGVVGTACILKPAGMDFVKGRSVVAISSAPGANSNQDAMLNLARGLAAGLDASEDDIPVLVKHLPNWQTAQPWARYAVSANSLQQDIPNQPIIREVNFEGGTEAVSAYFGQARLVIVEFTTPQLAGDNDGRIAAKIQEFRTAGQPVPSAYRRVGNYSVFVFDAQDEKTAAQLIDQVKYEQVVQWLGENPYWFEKVQRIYAQTTAGVLLTVIQSSGLSLLICLGIGGIFGVFLFRRRRAQQAGPAYSDAGGMVRLNIDEMTADGDRSKLLSDGKS